ncbi:MAG: hypothetical protein NTX24_01495 [Candidatus Pacearchaeota archaeon]|nr:hypothetical protein [Candidatus Pacearchaeota archaeon]
MPESKKLWNGKIVHAGIFDFKENYRFMYEWLMSHEYLVLEKKYTEKVKPEGGKFIEIRWTAYRKISNYFRFKMGLILKAPHIAPAEIQEGSMKVKRDKGEIEIRFDPGVFLEKDYENRWGKNGVLNFLRNLYDKYIIRSRIEFYEDMLKDESDEFANQIKAFLILSGKI